MHAGDSESRRDSVTVMTAAVAGLLRWLPCVGRRSHRVVGPTSSSVVVRPFPSSSSTFPLPAMPLSEQSFFAARQHSAMPLSQRELFTVVRSWKSIQSEITETGMRMFLRSVPAHKHIGLLVHNALFISATILLHSGPSRWR